MADRYVVEEFVENVDGIDQWSKIDTFVDLAAARQKVRELNDADPTGDFWIFYQGD